MPAAAVRVRGLKELNRSFGKMSAELKRSLRSELLEAGEPVRVRAEQLAAQEIRNIDPRWSQMRVGATSQLVYVAPRARRRTGSSRPNLAGLLLGRAMEPALAEETANVEQRIERLIDHIADGEGF